MARRCALVVALATLVLTFVPGASAHADPVEVYPPAGQGVADSPTEIWIRLTEPVGLSDASLQVTDLTGALVATGPVKVVDGARLEVAVPAALPDGGYLVRWSARSLVDAHPSTGAWGFAVGTGTAPIVTQVVEVPFPAWSAMGRGLAFAGLAVVVGSLVVRMAVVQAAPTRAPVETLRLLAVTGALVHAAGYCFFLMGELGASEHGIDRYLGTTGYGRGMAVRLTVALVLAVAVFVGTRLGKAELPVQAGLATFGILGFAFFSHTAAALSPRLLGTFVDAVHLAAVFAWSGGLISFFSTTSSRFRGEGIAGPTLLDLSRRFSAIAITSIVLLTASGVAMSAAILGSDVALWPERLSSTYGFFLVSKVALALVMVGLGGFNHLLFVKRFLRVDTPSVQELFRYNVRREALNGLVVLGLAGILTNLSAASFYAF